MDKTTKWTVVLPIVFELLGLALIFMAYLLAGGQDRTTYGFPVYTLAILGIILCGRALVFRGKAILQGKRGSKELFLGGADALIVSPFMLLLGLRILKLELSLFFSASIGVEPDIFNILSLVLVIMALATGGLGFMSMPSEF